MKNVIKKLGQKVIARLHRKLEPRLVSLDARLEAVTDSAFRQRSRWKRSTGQSIHVVFVCHAPALWSALDSIYRAMMSDARFSVTVVSAPYHHPTLPSGQYKDDGAFEFLAQAGISSIRGYDPLAGTWLNIADLAADYIFFQTPYPLFHESWSAELVSVSARICYVPYGMTLFRGEVDDASHPVDYFRFARLTFVENPFRVSFFTARFQREPWFTPDRIRLTGYPKLDHLLADRTRQGSAWKRGYRSDLKRVLWTPRWRTAEGTCHFFDYRDCFAKLCRERSDVDFVFRPHPLCLHNFEKTGELPAAQRQEFERYYERSANMAIDHAPEYHDTFLTSDLLVTDISSLMLEYFATGKPVVYTHRTNLFNAFGEELAKGFYWVRNEAELREVVGRLLSGDDPLRGKRQELMKSLLYLPFGGAGVQIKEMLKADFDGKTLVPANPITSSESPTRESVLTP